jgi:hypothetical protein
MDYNFIISPENIQGDLVTVNYENQPVGVYSGMTQILTAGPNGSSILTGLSVNILLTQTAVDAGYYSPFDGAILQKDVVANFIFSSTTGNPYTYYVYNTSSDFQKFLELSQYSIDWGDGSQIQAFPQTIPNYISHQYPTNTADQYKITVRQINPWGITIVEKTVNTPYTEVVAPNPQGTAYFVSNNGNWSATPVSYNYIFSGDAVNEVQPQESYNYITVPYTISGLTVSRLNELTPYGNLTPQQRIGLPIIQNGQIWGTITNIDPLFTAYTINTVDYYDFSGGTTIFFEQSYGFTSDNLTAVPITKNEALLKIIDQPQIQTDVFVERGKNSAYERVQRLGEVDNLGDMINYGYGFFNVENKD